jgi:hypothetical protein
MNNVLDFPTNYFPTFEEFQRLLNIQNQLQLWKAELHREQTLKRFTTGERWLSKQRFHAGIRDNWKVYEGFKEKNTLLIENKSS